MPLNIAGVEIGPSLGEGAFGKVYRARHSVLDIDVAVKVIDAAKFESPAGVDLAIAEARLMARLDHPNLLRIFDAGRIDNLIYLTLELMDGTCERMRRLPPDMAVDLAKQLLAGLQALHDARIIHRDIKPANCLLRSRDTRIKLGDLGIAVKQVTRTGEYDLAGTLPYMAPEAFESPPRFGPLSDLYALGMTLACIFLDEDPFPGRSQSELLAWIVGGARPRISSARPDLPATVSNTIERMIATDPALRPSSAADALVSLSHAIQLRRPAAGTTASATAIGPWLIGETVYTSSNWTQYAVTHLATGAAGRMAEVRPDSMLARAADTIMASAERASAFCHPGIIDVIDWATSRERTYVVTAPQGITVQQLIQTQGPLDEYEAVTFAASICDAIAYLHGDGLVYQTLDPGSVVISANARNAQLAWPLYCVPIGTPATDASNKPIRVWVLKWSPAEVIFEPDKGLITTDVDLYGLGETLYYMLAGKAAFDGFPTNAAVAFAKTKGVTDMRAKIPQVTAPTVSLLQRLLDPEPDGRPKSAIHVRDELRRVAARLSPPA